MILDRLDAMTPDEWPVHALVDPATFVSVMGKVCTPVAVVTSSLRDSPHGTTVSAFMSLSLRPPMILISLDRRSDLLAVITATRRFGINVLGASAGDQAAAFARKGVDKFDGIGWRWNGSLPRLAGTAAWIACSATAFLDGGDHVIITGLVEQAELQPMPPLIYHDRQFGTHSAYRPTDPST